MIESDETEIVGRRIPSRAAVVGDAACDRIAKLIEGHLGLDVVGAALPVVPATGSLFGIDADAAEAASAVVRGGENSAAALGRPVHRDLRERVLQKLGWQSEPRLEGLDNYYRPLCGHTEQPDHGTEARHSFRKGRKRQASASVRNTAWYVSDDLLQAMSERMPATWLTGVLATEGFQRRGQTWSRPSGAFIDVVNTQISKTGGEMTINAGVCAPELYVECWGRPLPTPIDEANCTVRVRVGELIDGRDRWWPLDDASAPQEVSELVRTHVLPFLDRMHSAEAMEALLTERRVVRQWYPPPIIYLALLKHRRGDVNEACAILRDLRQSTTEAWQPRVADVAKRLDCSWLSSD